MTRKLRVLYGASHRILRYEEVPLFIAAGFEVIPVKAHWEVFAVQEPGSDDPAHPLYPAWQSSCSIPEEVLQKIQAIDILKYHDMNEHGGKVTKAEADLINEWIDIIYIPNMLPTVTRILDWFEGLTLFRIYGEGKIMTYDEWAASSATDLNLLRQYDERYATMLMLHALKGPEHQRILGTNVFHLSPCVNRARLTKRWQSKQASAVCNTALSYIMENPHWTDMYHEFCQVFADIPLRFLGKNNKAHEVLKNDDRVVGLIQSDDEYMDLLLDCRCLIDPGTSPFHMHYTPVEAIIMGIPVIFLASSGMAIEVFRVIPQSELQDCGICVDFAEAAVIIKKCLADDEYAQALAAKQRIIAEKAFLPETTFKQMQTFAQTATALVEKARAFSATLKAQNHVSQSLLSSAEKKTTDLFLQPSQPIVGDSFLQKIKNKLKGVFTQTNA